MVATGRGRAFPEGFTWGTATAAHQIEGGNVNNDWWAFEHTPGSGCAESSGDACNSWELWDQRRRSGGRPRARQLPVLRGVEPDRAGRRRVLACRTGPLPPPVRGTARPGRRPGRDLPPLHHAAVAERTGWLGVGPRRRALWALLHRGGRGARRRHLRGPARSTSRTWWPPWVGRWGYSRPAGWTRRWPGDVSARFVAAHRLAVEAIRAAAPGVPVGLTLAMFDYQEGPDGAEKLQEIRHHAEDVFLDATGGDDFTGIQVLHPHADRTRGMDRWRPRECRSSTWATSSTPQPWGNCLRRTWDYTNGAVPLIVTENGIGTTDDGQRVDYVRQALSRRARRHRPGRGRPRLLPLVAARQLRVGHGLPCRASASSAWTARPSPARPNRARRGSPRWPRPTRSTIEGQRCLRCVARRQSVMAWRVPHWPRWRR